MGTLEGSRLSLQSVFFLVVDVEKVNRLGSCEEVSNFQLEAMSFLDMESCPRRGQCIFFLVASSGDNGGSAIVMKDVFVWACLRVTRVSCEVNVAIIQA